MLTLPADLSRRFLHVLPLYPDEVKLIYAAHEMHSDAIQGDIAFAAQGVLAFSETSSIGYGSGSWNPPIRSRCRRPPRLTKSFEHGFARL